MPVGSHVDETAAYAWPNVLSGWVIAWPAPRWRTPSGIFISYRRAEPDQSLAKFLVEKLEANGQSVGRDLAIVRLLSAMGPFLK